MRGRTKTTEEFASEAHAVHGDQYDYSLVEYRRSGEKVKVICPIHGVFEQEVGHHLRGRGCKKCTVIRNAALYRHTTDNFIQNVKAIHGDTYDYSLVNYGGWNVGVKIGCRKHGVFTQKPTIHLQGAGCPVCGRERQMVGIGREQEIVQMYNDGVSCLRIGEKIGIGDMAVLRILQRMGVSRRSCGRQVTYRVNHGYFKTIDTPEKAYWLGWMASDGFVSHGKYAHAIGLCVQERDREIIESFRMAIEAEHPIRTIRVKEKMYLELRVTSLQMVEDLEMFGIVQNKSLTLRCPEISEEFQWDFFRGMFDGDGCVGKGNMSLCGTREIVETFAKLCIKSGYGSHVHKHSRGTNTWYMHASGTNGRGILRKLYGDGQGLSRKRIKALAWIERMRERDERLAA